VNATSFDRDWSTTRRRVEHFRKARTRLRNRITLHECTLYIAKQAFEPVDLGSNADRNFCQPVAKFATSGRPASLSFVHRSINWLCACG
jgi:hypothetical protein